MAEMLKLIDTSDNGDKIAFLSENGSKITVTTDEGIFKVAITGIDGGVVVENEVDIGEIDQTTSSALPLSLAEITNTRATVIVERKYEKAFLEIIHGDDGISVNFYDDSSLDCDLSEDSIMEIWATWGELNYSDNEEASKPSM